MREGENVSVMVIGCWQKGRYSGFVPRTSIVWPAQGT